ncbi:MAG: divalent metal cation transporter, partial [Bacteroidota bacterium]
ALQSYFGKPTIGHSAIDPFGIIIGLIAMVILYIGRYKIIEKTLIVLVIIMSLVFITTAIISTPSLSEVFSGLLIPSLPDDSTLMVIGLIGTTIVPYNLFLQSGALLKTQKQDINQAKGETIFSVSIGGLISMSIVLTSAFVFFGKDQALSNTYDLALQLEPLLGNWSGLFMTVGFFAAGISSTITAPLAASYAVAGIMNWPADLRDKRIMLVWASTILLGIFFYSLGIKPLQLISIAQMANGLLLPFVAIFLMILVNKSAVIGNNKNTLTGNILGAIIIGVVVFLGLRSIWGVLS